MGKPAISINLLPIKGTMLYNHVSHFGREVKGYKNF